MLVEAAGLALMELAPNFTLALVGAINAAIGAYYYLRVVGVMYLRTPVTPPTCAS